MHQAFETAQRSAQCSQPNEEMTTYISAEYLRPHLRPLSFYLVNSMKKNFYFCLILLISEFFLIVSSQAVVISPLNLTSSPNNISIKADLEWAKLIPGYIAITKKDKLFYLLARSKIENAPLVIFLNGGPGASSLIGAFVENGPLNLAKPFDDDRNFQLTKNKWSWNNLANVVYLDQPRYTGYSYGNGSYITSAQDAGKDFLTWLQHFYQKYPEFKQRPLYLTGESFARVYIGEYTHQILQYNKQNIKNPIHLSGLFIQSGTIGDDQRFGSFDVSPLYQLHYLCTQNMLEKKECQSNHKNSLKNTLDQCVNTIAQHKNINPQEVKISDMRISGQSITICESYLNQVNQTPKFKLHQIPNSLVFPKQIRGKTLHEPVDTLEFSQDSKIRHFLGYSPNPYNIKLICMPSGGYPPWCYNDHKIIQFFNNPEIKLWLGKGEIPEQVKWEYANFVVANSFTAVNPLVLPLETYYAEALDNDIKIILAYGKNDWMNYFATQVIADKIVKRAYGRSLFRQLPAAISDLQKITIGTADKPRYAGEYLTLKNFTFAQLDNAGHMIGMDEPESIYQLYILLLRDE